MAKRATVVALVCGVVGGVIAGYFTGSAQLAVIWALICMPAPWLLTYFGTYRCRMGRDHCARSFLRLNC